MDYFVDKIKYRNALLLAVLFLVLNLLFVLVIRDLYIFRKARVSLNLVYEFDWKKFIAAFATVSGLLFLLISVKIKDFLYTMLTMVFIFFIIPSAIMYTNVNNIDSRIFLLNMSLFLMMLVIGKIKISIPSFTLNIKLSMKLLFFTVAIGILPFIILYLPYINFKNLFFIEIYETRAITSANVNNLYTNYSYSWFNKILIPCLFVFGVYFRNKSIIIFSVLSLIFLFLCGAHKAVFVGLIIVIILYKYNYRKKVSYFIKFILGLSLFSLVISVVFNNDFLTVLTVRRTIFLPSLLDILYFDFFQDNFLYWSETFNGLLRKYPYESPHSYVIGIEYFGRTSWNANNGIISDGFMNFGVWGVLINNLFISIYFSLINQLNISSKFFGVFFLLFFVVISSSLTTVMLTHGGFLLLILAFTVLKNTKSKMV